jgi:hypothetical protein
VLSFFPNDSASSAGDVNGDGLDDLIIEASNADPDGKTNAGRSFVVFGTADTGFSKYHIRFTCIGVYRSRRCQW